MDEQNQFTNHQSSRAISTRVHEVVNATLNTNFLFQYLSF
jgi:hypothetical protein